jgi:hypothetical protein
MPILPRDLRYWAAEKGRNLIDRKTVKIVFKRRKA